MDVKRATITAQTKQEKLARDSAREAAAAGAAVGAVTGVLADLESLTSRKFRGLKALNGSLEVLLTLSFSFSFTAAPFRSCAVVTAFR